MKKFTVLSILCVITVSAGCSLVDSNIRARKDLARCKVEFSGIEFNKLHHETAGSASADLTLTITVTNPNDGDVAMDRVDADLFLKDKKAGKIQHKNFVRIKAGESSSEKAAINIPFSDAMLFTEKRPDTLTVDALVYLSLITGTTDISTPIPVHVKKDIPIPWDKIDKQVNSREDEIKSRAKKFLKK